MGTLNKSINKEDLDTNCECGGKFNPNDRVYCMWCGDPNPKLNIQVKSPISKEYVDNRSIEDMASKQELDDIYSTGQAG